MSDANLLVIDDDEENRDILNRRLSSRGYTISTATDGNEGLALIKTSPVDLVLLDINMPVMNGIVVLKTIRDDESLNNLPVIMITAIEDMNIALECMRYGACGYITKPFDMKQLENQITNCLYIKK